ncbi:SICA antigen [Plasmodium coatneyi]|uniref:SICA antigen n=1 Tax=Plasmodium coatneyi TaxID=208452 RepID=A0A1B1DUQ2_9APIC|nr:SICA antigen [Plasmodium coatneyi]ANQ06305.1 SICA antigen [Plasmodium coatneyi]
MEYEFFSEFLVEWIQMKGYNTIGHYQCVGGDSIYRGIYYLHYLQGKILNDMKGVFEDLFKNLKEDAPEINKLCADTENDKGEKLTHNREKELCKALVKILYWISGLIEKEEQIAKKQWKWYWEKRKDIEQKNWKLYAYARCILGKITVAKLFWDHCDISKVGPIAKKAVEGTIDKKNVQVENDMCKKADLKSLSIAGIFLWDKMDKWIDEGTTKKGRLKDIRKNGQYCWAKKSSEEKEEEMENIRASTAEFLDVKDKDGIGDLIDSHGKGSEEELEKVAVKVKPGTDNTGNQVILKEIYKTLGDIHAKNVKRAQDRDSAKGKGSQAISDDNADRVTGHGGEPEKRKETGEGREGDRTVRRRKPDMRGNDPDKGKVDRGKIDKGKVDKGMDCKDKMELCDRVNCVTTNWFNDRITKAYQKQTWCQFWNNDVQNRLNDLSTAMTDTETGDYDLCKNIGEADGTSNKEAKRKACEYITKGLEHIYKIRKSGGWTEDDGDKQKKMERNQQFGQTMSCFLLNVYADQLIQKSAENGCSITEDKIQEMFDKGKTKMNEWCKNNGGTCIECTRKKDLTCTLNVKENLWDAGGSARCMDYNNIRNKVEGLLKADTKVKRTLNSICRDCTKEGKTLCQRVECVANNWFEDRIGPTENKQTWCTFWNTDAKNRLKGISEKMLAGAAAMDSLCKSADGKTITLNAAGKKACQYIFSGLKYIYEVKENTALLNKKKARNFRLTDQTMYCLFLNAYADMLIQKTKGQVCPILEEEIKDMFNEGNKNRDNWCEEKKNGKGGDCVPCTRDTSYAKCELSVDNDLWDKNSNCQENKDNVEKKVDDLLDTSQKTEPKVKEAVNAINDINKNNNLCDRVKCIYYRWGENRKYNGTYQDWDLFWDADVKNRLNELFEKIVAAKDETIDAHCNSTDEKNTTLNEAQKKACEYIVKGLKHIYKIPKGTDGTDQQKIDDNLIFHRTFSCMLLNIFADEMETKCSANKKADIEKGITHAFQQSDKIKKDISPCKTEGDLCPLCTQDNSYKDCKIQKSDGDTIKKRFDEMLDPKQNMEPKVKQVLKAITDICPKPAATKPPTTSSTERRGRSESSGDSAPPPAEKVPANKEGEKTDEDEEGKCKAGLKDAGANSASVGVSVGAACTSNADLGEPSKELIALYGGGGESTTTQAVTEERRTPKSVDHGTPDKSGTDVGHINGIILPLFTLQVKGTLQVVLQVIRRVGILPPLRPKFRLHNPQLLIHNTLLLQVVSYLVFQVHLVLQVEVPLVVIQVVHHNKVVTNHKVHLPQGNHKEQQYPHLGVLQRLMVVQGGGVASPPPFLFQSQRTHRVRGPPSLEEQLPDHVNDQADGPHEYTLVKKRRQPRSAPTKTMRPKKQGVGRPAGPRGVGRRTIIDIHLEVLDECQKGDLQSTIEDFFEILVQEFMGCEFMKKENVPKE